MKGMKCQVKVLIACEESQRVCSAFRELGHEAYSCDIQKCSGGHPEWHICNDALDIINGNTDFFTTDGKLHTVNKWDLIIAHPLAVENPVGVMNTVYRSPDQIIHPYYFGDPELKRTCLWLKNLPVLDYSETIIDKPKPIGIGSNGKKVYFTEGCSKNRSVARSKTFPGIARAMAEQWGGKIN